MRAFMKDFCYEQERVVQVNYLGVRDNKHRFRVSSLSRPGMTHMVHLQIDHRFDYTRGMEPEEMCMEGLVKVWSSDEWFKYGGCQYNATMQNYALYPEFRAPKTAEHDYGMSHTGYAVLDLVARTGGGVFKTNFEAVCVWNDDTNKYDFTIVNG